MATYVDEAIWEWRGRRWCHLTADSQDELHELAARLGLLRQCPDLRVALGGHLAWNDRYKLATVSPRQLPRLVEHLKSIGIAPDAAKESVAKTS